MADGTSPWQEFLDRLRAVGAVIVDGLTIAALNVDHAYLQVNEFLGTCSRYGWCFVPDPSFAFLFDAVQRVNRSSRPHRELYRVLRDHFMAKDWTELANLMSCMTATRPKRLKILHDCAVAMKMHGRKTDKRTFNACNLVVPTMIVAVEGMLSDFARDLGLSRWRRDRFQLMRDEIESVAFLFDAPTIDLIFDVLFCFGDANSDAVPDSGLRFNRHKIVHGNWLEYGRIENVLRLFLMARFLDYIVDEYWRRRELGRNEPVSELSQYSKLLSENMVAPIRELLRERAASRGLALPSPRDQD